MTIDSRAWTWCNLGDLADETSSITEDHAQRVGVIMYRGTINIKGIVRPSAGTVVDLAYSDGQNWIARLPLRLRVLSSFCNALLDSPVTSISVGCDFAYYNDRKQPPATLSSKVLQPGIPDAVWQSAAPSLPASVIVQKILTDLGLTTTESIPLTNYMLVDEFNMTAGYVAELDKLCSSEGYAARMKENGTVEFIQKGPSIAAGPLITKENLIDFNPINTGDLPGEAVFAKYTANILSASIPQPTQNELQKRNWERESSSSEGTYTHTWTYYELDGTGQFQQVRNIFGVPLYVTATGQPLMEEIKTVRGFEREEEIPYLQSSIAITNYDSKDRAVSRITTATDQWGPSRTESYYEYRDGFVGGSFSPTITNINDNGEITREVTIEYAPLASVRQSLGQQSSYQDLFNSGTYQALRREVSYKKDKDSGITQTTTKEWVPFMNTADGAEVISRLRERKKPWESIADLIPIATRLVQKPIEVRVRTEREFGIQRRPPEVKRSMWENIKVPAVESYEKFEWLFGSAASQTSIELSPPYVSDDRIEYIPGDVGEPITFKLIPGDASIKALNYARIENALLFGHRNGNGIQVLPEDLPIRPLSWIYIRLQNATAAFLVNGRTWNISPSGVTCTADALFHSAVDAANVNNAWFPLSSDITTLPGVIPATINPNPKPANAIAIPSGFNYLNPGNIFSVLPKGQPPVFASTISPTSSFVPYSEILSLFAGVGIGIIAEPEDWIAPPYGQLFVGAGIGTIYQDLFLDIGICGVGIGIFTDGIETGNMLFTGVGVGVFAIGALIEEPPPSEQSYPFVDIIDVSPYATIEIGEVTISVIIDWTNEMVFTEGVLDVSQSGNTYTLEWNMPLPMVSPMLFQYFLTLPTGKRLSAFSNSYTTNGGTVTANSFTNTDTDTEPTMLQSFDVSGSFGATKITHILQLAPV